MMYWVRRLVWPHGIRCYLYWCPPWHARDVAGTYDEHLARRRTVT